MKKGVCRLCGEEKELLNKSHIIPDCMYQDLYDENHKIRKFEPSSYFKGNSYMQRLSSGEYEGGLLCAECDNVRIGQLESYACQLLYAKGSLPQEITPEIKHYRDNVADVSFYQVSNVNYTKFKLFILSILWRAGISNREGFNQILLEENEPMLRDIILKGNPQTEDNYPIFFFGWIKGGIARDMIQQPVTINEKHGKRYMFPINGLVYNIYTHLEDIKPELRPYTLKERGEFTVFNMSMDVFNKFIKKYHGS